MAEEMLTATDSATDATTVKVPMDSPAVARSAATNTTRHRRNYSANSAVFSMYVKRHLNADRSMAEHRSSIIFYCVSGLLTVVCLIGFIAFLLITRTNLYNNFLIQKLALEENSSVTNFWMKPSIEPLLRVHVFNYTNVDRPEEKLHVRDLGPYVYRESVEKVDVVFHANNTISYRERRNYTFVPELSSGSNTDRVIVPNILLNSVYMKAKIFLKDFDKTTNTTEAVTPKPISTNLISIFANSFFDSVDTVIKTAQQFFHTAVANADPFKTVTVDELIWGYEDELLFWLKLVPNSGAPAKVGMLYSRIGTSPELITVRSGVDDIGQLNVIDHFDGRAHLDMWSSDECNRIDGTDGSQFPPMQLDRQQPLHVFTKVFCRRIPLHFAGEVDVLDGIAAYRYRTPMTLFEYDSGPEAAANRCYCLDGRCPPSGVLDVSRCLDLPILLSYPHFLAASNETLFAKLDGLNPREELHRSYADVHPRLGFPVGGASRIQINVRMAKEIKKLGGEILPVIWMEISSGTISDEMRNALYHSSASANAFEMLVIYGSLLVWVSSMTMIGLLIRRRRIVDAQSPTTVHVGVEYQAAAAGGGGGVATLRLPGADGQSLSVSGQRVEFASGE